ncbi:unnamed protein product [Dracunculus medinensis]|uniref:MFS domain-containing protein n=1 Tax=Dracunculus medinensis TaxID=318479 RepID=A0A158Q3Z6_DRAME|nr:unnamed protein product [Dracunculus medinensis]
MADNVEYDEERNEESKDQDDGKMNGLVKSDRKQQQVNGYTDQRNLIPEPPDGGYGWVIVCIAFLSNFIVDGISNSFGAFVNIYQQHFNETKAAVSLIGSLLIGCYLLIGPVAGGLVNKYGARKVAITGSLISALSFAASIVSSNIYIFMIFYGVLGGIGFGLIFLPAIVYVSYYFESRRSIATGIAVAGSGVGTFVMPQICMLLLNKTGWQATVCVLAAFSLLCGIVAFLYKPLEPPSVKDDLEKEPLKDSEIDPRPMELFLDTPIAESPTKKAQRGLSSLANMDLVDIPSGMEPEKFARLRSALSECENPSTPVRPSLSPITEHPARAKRTESAYYTHAERAYSLSTRARKLTLTSTGSEMASTQDLKNRLCAPDQLSKISVRSYAQSMNRLNYCNQMKGAQSLLSVVCLSILNLDKRIKNSVRLSRGLIIAVTKMMCLQNSVHSKEFARPMNRRDIFYMGSICNLHEFVEEGRNYRSYRESQTCIPAAVASQELCGLSQVGDIVDIQSKISGSRISRVTGGVGPEEEELMEYFDDSKFKWLSLSVRSAVSEMIDIQLLKEPVMVLLCVSNLLSMLGFYVPFMFTIDMAIKLKIMPEKASLLLSIIGRIAFGWIADRGWISSLSMNNASLIICGLLTCACPFLNDFISLACYASLFGFIIAAYVCLTSIVLTDLLGLERLTNSFGLLVVSRGIASLLGTPLAGLICDLTNSYDISFCFSGSLIILSGLVSCVIPYFHRLRRDRIAYEVDEVKEMKAEDVQSGKLSVLTERSEENLTEYQRTIQSLRQQQKLLREYEEERKTALLNKSKKPQTVDESEESEDKNEIAHESQ